MVKFQWVARACDRRYVCTEERYVCMSTLWTIASTYRQVKPKWQDIDLKESLACMCATKLFLPSLGPQHHSRRFSPVDQQALNRIQRRHLLS